MTAVGKWQQRYRDYDFIGQTARGLRSGVFQPPFVVEANAPEKLNMAEHVASLKVALALGRLSLERSLIKASDEKHWHRFMKYAIDLNIIRNLQWKVEQDSKGR